MLLSDKTNSLNGVQQDSAGNRVVATVVKYFFGGVRTLVMTPMMFMYLALGLLYGFILISLFKGSYVIDSRNYTTWITGFVAWLLDGFDIKIVIRYMIYASLFVSAFLTLLKKNLKLKMISLTRKIIISSALIFGLWLLLFTLMGAFNTVNSGQAVAVFSVFISFHLGLNIVYFASNRLLTQTLAKIGLE